ncbi:MAG: hypothetical protein WA629_01810, partial [Candidatus Aquilonibacter sp.]
MSKSVVLFLGLLIGTMPATVTAQPSGPSAVAQIDAECDAVLSAVSQASPVNVILHRKQWIVLTDAQLPSLTGSLIPHYAGVYKQGSRYRYVREVSIDKNGRQHALGLCYRSDGTLERARQAKTVPELSSETAQRAYYAVDGARIQNTPGFNEQDPTI